MATKIGNILTGGPTGATGPTGPAGPSGTGGGSGGGLALWSSATAYTSGQVTLYNGGFYQAVATSTNVPPTTDNTKWLTLGFLAPASGTAGQALKKASDADGDLLWGDDLTDPPVPPPGLGIESIVQGPSPYTYTATTTTVQYIVIYTIQLGATDAAVTVDGVSLSPFTTFTGGGFTVTIWLNVATEPGTSTVTYTGTNVHSQTAVLNGAPTGGLNSNSNDNTTTADLADLPETYTTSSVTLVLAAAAGTATLDVASTGPDTVTQDTTYTAGSDFTWRLAYVSHPDDSNADYSVHRTGGTAGTILTRFYLFPGGTIG